MAKPVPRVFGDSPRRGRAGGLHPYFFQRDTSDVLEEAFDELLQGRVPAGRPIDGLVTDEREVLREQRWTLFTYDEAMQRMFGGDFDAFCAAMEDPKLMHERLEERLRRLRSERRTPTDRGTEPREHSGWDDYAAPVRRWEDAQVTAPSDDAIPCADCGNVHDREEGAQTASLDNDPVYDAAFQWACRTNRWSRRMYFDQHVRDRDLFRVFVNATLVPAKVAFAFSGGLDDDLAGLEVAAMGYRQAAIFLTRTLESLANCYGKRIGRSQTVHHLADDGHELLADIESKLAEIESEIRHRGKTP
ncbi:hypothetical protein HY635_02195 [Candidatus Uhrbacteria bacterium]|nr:hypothetical protein [Candidatus Uhrbacteria bacterium]